MGRGALLIMLFCFFAVGDGILTKKPPKEDFIEKKLKIRYLKDQIHEHKRKNGKLCEQMGKLRDQLEGVRKDLKKYQQLAIVRKKYERLEIHYGPYLKFSEQNTEAKSIKETYDLHYGRCKQIFDIWKNETENNTQTPNIIQFFQDPNEPAEGAPQVSEHQFCTNMADLYSSTAFIQHSITEEEMPVSDEDLDEMFKQLQISDPITKKSISGLMLLIF